jgi:hypothetical protein
VHSPVWRQADTVSWPSDRSHACLVFKPAALACDLHGVGVMKQSIHHRRRQRLLVREDYGNVGDRIALYSTAVLVQYRMSGADWNIADDRNP